MHANFSRLVILLVYYKILLVYELFYLSTKFYLSILLVREILLVYSTCLQNSTCLFYLSLFVCLKAKKIDTELVSFSERDKNRLIEPASPIFSEARATSREMSRDESAIFPDGAARSGASSRKEWAGWLYR